MIQWGNLTKIPNRIKFWQWELHELYLLLVGLFGLLIVFHGLIDFPSYEPRTIFITLTLMAITAQIANASAPWPGGGGITFEVGTAVSAAAIPLFGPAAAAFIAVISMVSLWFLKSYNEHTWKKSWRQLFFNSGMSSISIYLAGVVFNLLQNLLGPNTILGGFLSWLAAGILMDQINIWLLLGIVRLQQGKKAEIVSMWKDNWWASLMNIAIITMGGGSLAFAAVRYDWVGTVIFFLPIFLSAFAFMVYVRGMRKYMDNLEMIIAERTAELSEAMREKDAFLAVLTHDMKTPLTTIGMYADIMIKQPDIAISKPRIPHVIRDNQQSLLNIVDNILDLEKIQIGNQLNLDIRSVDLIPIMEYLVESLAIQAERKRIALTYNFAVPMLPLACDPDQIERVLQNLLSNAIKYTPTNGSVCLAVRQEEEAAEIVVSDTGYGIPAEELPHIFDRFHRVAKHQHLSAGTGLGLAIAKAIIEAHKGTLSVTSAEEEGSTFLIRLPL